jgi:hypothetical protein
VIFLIGLWTHGHTRQRIHDTTTHTRRDDAHTTHTQPTHPLTLTLTLTLTASPLTLTLTLTASPLTLALALIASPSDDDDDDDDESPSTQHHTHALTHASPTRRHARARG